MKAADCYDYTVRPFYEYTFYNTDCELKTAYTNSKKGIKVGDSIFYCGVVKSIISVVRLGVDNV